MRIPDSIRAAAGALLARGLGLLLQLLMNMALGRMLGTTGMGLYSLYTAWMMLLASLADLGLPPATLRTSSVLEQQQRRAAVRRFVLRAVRIAAVSGGIVLLLVLLLASSPLAATLSPDGRILPFAVAAALLFMVIKIVAEALKGVRQVNLSLAAETIVIPAGVLLVCGFYWLSETPFGVTPFLISHLLLLLLNLLLIGWLLHRHTRTPDKSDGQEPQLPDRSLLPFWGGGLLNMLFMNLPLLMLPWYADTDEIGLFGVAYRLILIGTTILVTLASLFGPRFARAYANGEWALLRSDLRQSQLLSLLLYLPMLVALTLFAEPVLALFGEPFVDAALLLAIMVAGQLINTATGLVGVLMNMIHQERQEFLAQLLSTLFMVVAILLLGDELGVVGVAIGYSLAVMVKNIGSLLLSLHHLQRLSRETK